MLFFLIFTGIFVQSRCFVDGFVSILSSPFTVNVLFQGGMEALATLIVYSNTGPAWSKLSDVLKRIKPISNGNSTARGVPVS